VDLFLLYPQGGTAITIGGERAAAQNRFLRYVGEAGWTDPSRGEALDLRRGITSPALDVVLVEQLPRLNHARYGNTVGLRKAVLGSVAIPAQTKG